MIWNESSRFYCHLYFCTEDISEKPDKTQVYKVGLILDWYRPKWKQVYDTLSIDLQYRNLIWILWIVPEMESGQRGTDTTSP
jgi:hypothetical protein